VLSSTFTLSDAQFVVAREAGFTSWPQLKRSIEAAQLQTLDRDDVVEAALNGEDAIVTAAIARDPEMTRRSIDVAAVVADISAMNTLLDADASIADRRCGAREWTPLLYVCCSTHRRGDRDVDAARVAIARRLIALGADVNATGHVPGFTSDSVTRGFEVDRFQPLAGAASCAVSLPLVRLLLEAGAAVVRTKAILTHAVRGGDLDILQQLLADAPNDWFEVIWGLRACAVVDRADMARLLTAHAAEPTMLEPALLEAIRRDRSAEMIGVLLGRETTPLSRAIWQNAYRDAMRHGNLIAADTVETRLGVDTGLTTADRLIAACFRGDRSEAQGLASGATRVALSDDDHRILSWAIRTGHHGVVPLLVEAGLDPNVPDADGELPLHLAAHAGRRDLVVDLLRHGARPNEPNFDGQTALEVALALPETAAARAEVLAVLRSAGAISRPASEQPERDVLFERAADAVAFGDLDTLRRMLDEEPALVHARSPRPHRATLLHYCAANGTEHPRQRTPPNAPQVAELLLQRGADPNATCRLYDGAATTMGLMLSSAHPNAAGVDGELVRVLARYGATLETHDLMGAIEYGMPRAVSALVEAGTPIDNLFVAAGVDRLDVIGQLLSQGVDVNTRFREGGYSTALHAAASMGHERAASLLLERGADPTAINKWGATPASAARFFDRPDMAELIERKTS
jgi:ankyrin repeat protein